MIVGIDLGTTNSLVAVWRDDAPQLVPNALGSVITPSVVGLDDQGLVLVGQAARERLQTHPQLTAALFKRHMGSAQEIILGKRRFRPEELSALVLRSLKEDVERVFGEPVEEAVISVPAYFSDAQRKATRIAGELAGLKVDKLVNEPTAAALAYGVHQKGQETSFLVFDLGGGTFDVSILELFEGVMEVRASISSPASARTSSFPMSRPPACTTVCAGKQNGCAMHLACNPAPASPWRRVAGNGRWKSPWTTCSASAPRYLSACAGLSSGLCAMRASASPTSTRSCWWAALPACR